MASESGCPIEMHRIEIEKCDDMYDKECRGEKYIPFHRAAYDRNTGQSPNAPREQINQMTAWIDGSFIYSTSEAWLNAMRSFENGTLLADASGTMPVRNTMRVPLFNNPVPHVMRTLSPERLYRELTLHYWNQKLYIEIIHLSFLKFWVIRAQIKTPLCCPSPSCSSVGTTCWRVA